MTLAAPSTRRSLLLGAGALAVPAAALSETPDWRSLARGRQSPQPVPGRRFTAAYLVEFWKRAPPGYVSPEDSPSLKAPGHVQPGFVDLPVHGPRRPTAAQLATFRRRFDLAREALLSQPSLSDMRGAAINMQCRIESFADGVGIDGGRMSVEMGLSFRPLNLDNPATFQRDGRYYTPGEGSTLQVDVNAVRGFREPRLTPAFNVGPNTLFDAPRSLFGVYWINPDLGPLPPAFAGDSPTNNLDHIPRGGDPTRIHLLSARWTGGYSNSDVVQGELSPTSPKGRALAALYMVDWPALVRRMQAA